MNTTQINATIIFTLITLGLGYSVLYLAKASRQKNPIISVIELAGVGLATFSFLSVLLNILHVPLHVAVFLALASIVPLVAAYKAFREQQKSEFSWKSLINEEMVCAVILLIVLALYFSLFWKGANVYPWLEDDDPWTHAMSATYVAKTHTYSVDPAVRLYPFAFYLEPYPPTYDVIMGVMRQTNDSIIWTLKYFNVIMLMLGLAFCYLFAKAYLKSDLKALFATSILAVLPSFMSHFIWSQTLAMILIPVAFYALVQALEDDSWRIPAILLVASELVTQPVVSFVFGVAVLILVALLFLHEQTQPATKTKAKTWWAKLLERYPLTTRGFIVGAGGVLLSFLYWGSQLLKWGISGILKIKGGEIVGGWASAYALQAYSFAEIVFAPSASRIDQAVGFGLVLSLCILLTVFALLLTGKRTLSIKNGYLHLHLLLWTGILAYAVFAPSLGFPGWATSRSWAYLAIPLALLVTEGIFILVNGIAKNYVFKLVVLLLVIGAIAWTSLPAKIAVQTAQWPPGAQWTAPQVEIPAYLEMQKQIPKNSRLFSFCSGEHRSIGFDMQTDAWDPEVLHFRERFINVSGDEIVAFLQQHDYSYVSLDATCVREYGENETVAFVNKISATQHFQPIMTPPGFLLARVQ